MRKQAPSRRLNAYYGNAPIFVGAVYREDSEFQIRKVPGAVGLQPIIDRVRRTSATDQA